MNTAAATQTGAAAVLRRALLTLAMIQLVGTAVELALLRHWESAVQLIPWLALGLLAAGVFLMARHPSPRSIRIARRLTIIVALTAVVGMVEHVLANYKAGPLDARYSMSWSTLPATSRWWAAVTTSVGPAPSLVPNVLAEAALSLWFTTLRHPARGSGSAEGEALPRGDPRSAELLPWERRRHHG